MAGQGAGPIAWEPGGLGCSAAAVETPPLTLPAATPAAAPFPGRAAPRRTARAAPGAVRLSRRPGPRGPAAHVRGCGARRWAGGRWEIGPRGQRRTMARRPGAPAAYGEEFSFVSPLVKYLLFFFNMLFWVRLGGQGAQALQGIPGAPRGLPVAGVGRPGLSGAQERGEWCRLVLWAGDTSGACLLGRNTTVLPCQEGTLGGGIILAARDEGLAGMRICVRPKEMCLVEELAGQPYGHVSWLGTFRPGCWKARLPKQAVGEREREGRETPSLPSLSSSGGWVKGLYLSLLQASVSAPVKAEKG